MVRCMWLAAALLLSGCAGVERLPAWMAQGGTAPAVEWSMEGGGPGRVSRGKHAFAGGDRGHHMIRLTAADRFAPEECSTPIVIGGVAFVGHSERRFEAVRLEDGKRLWQYPTSGRVYTTAAYADGLFVIGDDAGVVHCVDLTGAAVWTFPTQYPVVSSPVIANGKVYVAVSDQNIFCLDLATGSPIWQYGRKQPPRHGVWRSVGLSYAEGRVYGGFADGTVVALDAALGRVLWRQQVGGGQLFGDVTAGPAVADDRVYAGVLGGPVASLDAVSGDLLWQRDIQAASGFAVGPDAVYLGTSDGAVSALARDDGKEVWSVPLDGGVPSPPVLAGDTVVSGASAGAVFVLDAASGRKLFRYWPGPGVQGQPLVFADGLLFQSDGGTLHWLR